MITVLITDELHSIRMEIPSLPWASFFKRYFGTIYSRVCAAYLIDCKNALWCRMIVLNEELTESVSNWGAM